MLCVEQRLKPAFLRMSTWSQVWGNTPESAQRLRALAGLFGDLLWPLFVSLRLGRAFLLTH